MREPHEIYCTKEKHTLSEILYIVVKENWISWQRCTYLAHFFSAYTNQKTIYGFSSKHMKLLNYPLIPIQNNQFLWKGSWKFTKRNPRFWQIFLFFWMFRNLWQKGRSLQSLWLTKTIWEGLTRGWTLLKDVALAAVWSLSVDGDLVYSACLVAHKSFIRNPLIDIPSHFLLF